MIRQQDESTQKSDALRDLVISTEMFNDSNDSPRLDETFQSNLNELQSGRVTNNMFLTKNLIDVQVAGGFQNLRNKSNIPYTNQNQVRLIRQTVDQDTLLERVTNGMSLVYKRAQCENSAELMEMIIG